MSYYPKFLTCSILFVLFSFVIFAQKNSAGTISAKPDIILIVADYMGYADIQPFGHTEIRTPSLNLLASEGIKYTNFYAAAPVCSPSRAALLTGLYPEKTGLTHNIARNDIGLTPQFQIIATKLKNAGYATALIGKWKYLNNNGKELLFDLERDPDECKNISASHPQIMDNLRTELQHWKDNSNQ